MKPLAIGVVLFIALWSYFQPTAAPVEHHRVPEQRCPYPDWSLEHYGAPAKDFSCYGTTPA